MSNNVKNGIIVAIALIVFASVVALTVSQIYFNANKKIANFVQGKSDQDIANEIKESIEDYNFYKEHNMRQYKIDVHENYNKYVSLNTDSLTNQIKKESELCVSNSFDKVFENNDNTVLLANYSTEYNYNFQSKEEFYQYCVNSIIYETLTEITNQIKVESIIRN